MVATQNLVKTWQVQCTIVPFARGWIIFKFTSDKDRMAVLAQGPHNAFGKQLVLKVLAEDFKTNKEAFLDVPLWVKLKEVPLELWNKRGLSKIASRLGRPIHSDKVTKDQKKLSYARVLVEVNLRKEPVKEFPIMDAETKEVLYMQKIEYENFPNFCIFCQKFSHSFEECRAKKPTTKTDAQKGKETARTKPNGQGDKEMATPPAASPPLEERTKHTSTTAAASLPTKLGSPSSSQGRKQREKRRRSLGMPTAPNLTLSLLPQSKASSSQKQLAATSQPTAQREEREKIEQIQEPAKKAVCRSILISKQGDTQSPLMIVPEPAGCKSKQVLPTPIPTPTTNAFEVLLNEEMEGSDASENASIASYDSDYGIRDGIVWPNFEFDGTKEQLEEAATDTVAYQLTEFPHSTKWVADEYEERLLESAAAIDDEEGRDDYMKWIPLMLKAFKDRSTK